MGSWPKRQNQLFYERGANMKKILFVLVMLILIVPPSQVLAKDGFYIGGELGLAVAPEMDLKGNDNDYGTLCDKHINPTGFQTTENPGGLASPTDCSNVPTERQTVWFHNGIDGGTGLLAGVSLGYRMGSFRVEGEYFYRGTTYDSTASSTIINDEETTRKAEQELDRFDGAVDDVLSHNFFANLYYDYQSDSKFTPYVGVGVGFARVSLDYFTVWRRKVDYSDINTFKDTVSGEDSHTASDLNRVLAGTTTIGRGKLSDTMFGYQIIAGVDYWVSEPVSIGLKFRWADFSEFEDGREWDQLRSHPSTNLRPGDPVRYIMSTDDIQFWGVSLNMKYQF